MFSLDDGDVVFVDNENSTASKSVETEMVPWLKNQPTHQPTNQQTNDPTKKKKRLESCFVNERFTTRSVSIGRFLVFWPIKLVSGTEGHHFLHREDTANRARENESGSVREVRYRPNTTTTTTTTTTTARTARKRIIKSKSGPIGAIRSTVSSLRFAT